MVVFSARERDALFTSREQRNIRGH